MIRWARPGEFLEIVNDLRPTASSEYTESETADLHPASRCRWAAALEASTGSPARPRVHRVRGEQMSKIGIPENPLRCRIVGAGPPVSTPTRTSSKTAASTPRSTFRTAPHPLRPESGRPSRPTIRRSSRSSACTKKRPTQEVPLLRQREVGHDMR